MLLSSLKKILKHLNPQEKRNLAQVIALNSVTALTDTMGILSIFPFLQLVMNTKIIHDNRWLQKLYTLGGFQTDKSFLIFAGITLLAIFTSASVLKGYTLWFSNHFAYHCNKNTSTKLLKIYFNESYLESIQKNSAQVAGHLLTNVDIGISNVLNSWVGLFSSTVIVSLLIGTLFLTQPLSALFVLIGVGILYYFLDRMIKDQLQSIGAEIVKNSRIVYKHLNEATGGVKELKYLGRAAKVTDDYHSAYKNFIDLKIKNNVFQFMPKLIIDVLAFSIGIMAIIFVLDKDVDLTKSIPWMGLFGFIVLRLVPNTQVILQQISNLRFSNNALDLVFTDLLRYENLSRPKPNDKIPFSFNEKIEFKNVSFSYTPQGKNVLSNISLSINKGDMVAFVGKTGSGKTSLIDLVLGLIHPKSGTIAVDDEILSHDNIHRWQKIIGYVPQFVFLSDSTISKNVAFGINEEYISKENVIEACKKANIHDFIMEKLPLGYDTIIGERGVQLSGGQRQRLGIARALYHNPEVIILDEATSALDNKTEDHVMDEINKIAGIKTILIIAHRLTTVEKCNKIFLLENGTIISSGNYAEMILKEPSFFLQGKLKNDN